MIIKEIIRFDHPEKEIIKRAYRWANFGGRWTPNAEAEKPYEMKVQSRLATNDWLTHKDVLVALDYWKQVRDDMEAQIEEYQKIKNGEASMFASPAQNKMTIKDNTQGGVAVAEVPLVANERQLASDMIDNWEYGVEEVKRLCNMLFVASQSIRPAPEGDPRYDSDEASDEMSDDFMALPEDTFIVRR